MANLNYEGTGLKQRDKKPAASSLKKLAGGWSEREAAEFLESIKPCEVIDHEMRSEISEVSAQSTFTPPAP